MLNYNYEFSYKNVTYYFNKPQLPEKLSENKIKVVAICNECGKEQLIPLKLFKDCVNKRGKFMCVSCKNKNHLVFRVENFPENLHIEIIGPTYKNDPTRLKNNTKLRIECQECHEVEEIQGLRLFDTFSELGTFICSKCKRKHTNLERYGVENCAQSKECQEKTKQTNIKKYGVEHYFQTEEFLEKVKATNQEKYGVDWAQQNNEIKEKGKQIRIEKYGVPYYTQTEEFLEKVKATNLERYGAEYYAQTEECQEKIKQTCLERYGVDCSLQAEEAKEKSKQTCLKKYGVPRYSQSPEWQERIVKTTLERYGVKYYTQTEEYQKRSNKKYKYKGINFDSGWELAYFIYNKDYNIPTIRSPQSIEYFLGEEKHYYYPDFLVGEQLIEIKSSDMLNEDFSLKPPTKKLIRCQTEEERQYLYDLCAVKTQCMRENNVQIISDKEIKPYLKYIRNVYGKDYLKQFQTVKENNQNTSEELDILDEDIEDIDELD